jgi:hypothetical protein
MSNHGFHAQPPILLANLFQRRLSPRPEMPHRGMDVAWGVVLDSVGIGELPEITQS